MKKYAFALKPVIVSCVIIAAYLLIYFLYPPLLDTPRLKAQDAMWRLRHSIVSPPEESKKIILISVDDAAYSQYRNKWQWNSETFASLIYNITKGKPSVVGINLAFLGVTEKSGTDDLLLKIAFQDAGNIIGASYFDVNGKYIVPNEYFSYALKGYGFTNKPADSDKVIRNIKLFEPFPQKNYDRFTDKDIFDYGFEIKILCSFLNVPSQTISFENGRLILNNVSGKPIKIPSVQNGTTPLNFTTDEKELHEISVIDVLADKIPPETFKNKIVLIGTKGKIFREENLTPLGIFSGTEIAANALIMILSQQYMHAMPSSLELLLFMVFIGVLTYYFWRFGAPRNLILLLIAVAIFYFLGIFLVVNNITMDFFSIPICLVISYMSVEATKYSTLVLSEIKLKNMAVEDPQTGLFTRRYFMFRLNSDLIYALNEKRHLSVILFSLDNLEQSNRVLSIEASETILKKVAQLIKKNSRTTRRGDFVARYKEYIFSITLRETPQQGAVKYVNRIKPLIEHPITLPGGEEIRPIISTAITSIDTVQTSSAIDFMQYAENALAYARQSTKDRIYIQEKKIGPGEIKPPDSEKSMDEIDLSFVAEELNGKNKELQEAIHKLKTAYTEMANFEKLSAVGKLASSIHHELNNPLSALRTCLQTITKNLNQPTDQQLIQKTSTLAKMALEEVQRMIEMNKRLKDLYKPARVNLEPVNVNNILSDVLDFLRGEFSKKHIELVNKLAFDIPAVQANAIGLKQAFLNIILNAMDAMPEGGKLFVETTLVANKQILEISITDTGCGIPQEHLDKIFEPMFTTKGETKGSGLGLYVTKQQIEQQNGTIKVISSLNKGTTFTISLLVK